jgi:hypothetical protein
VLAATNNGPAVGEIKPRTNLIRQGCVRWGFLAVKFQIADGNDAVFTLILNHEFELRRARFA